MENNYRLDPKTGTNGALPDPSEIDTLNDFGMAPIHVAAQAGKITDLEECFKRGADKHVRSTIGDDVFFFIRFYLAEQKYTQDAVETARRMGEIVKNAPSPLKRSQVSALARTAGDEGPIFA